MAEPKAKSPGQSAVETRYLVMPHQANPHGTAFGGVIMAWIDMVAGMAARRDTAAKKLSPLASTRWPSRNPSVSGTTYS